MLDQPLTARLQSKSVKQSIISSIARDFNLTPILAAEYFSQISDYFLQHAEVELSSGQCQYLAVDENEPAGKLRKGLRRREAKDAKENRKYRNGRQPGVAGCALLVQSQTGRAALIQHSKTLHLPCSATIKYTLTLSWQRGIGPHVTGILSGLA
jgi:hypothetical protein